MLCNSASTCKARVHWPPTQSLSCTNRHRPGAISDNSLDTGAALHIASMPVLTPSVPILCNSASTCRPECIGHLHNFVLTLSVPMLCNSASTRGARMLLGYMQSLQCNLGTWAWVPGLGYPGDGGNPGFQCLFFRWQVRTRPLCLGNMCVAHMPYEISRTCIFQSICQSKPI